MTLLERLRQLSTKSMFEARFSELPVKVLTVENLICQASLFKLRHFSAICLKSLQSKNRENEQAPASASESKNICQPCRFRLRYCATQF